MSRLLQVAPTPRIVRPDRSPGASGQSSRYRAITATRSRRVHRGGHGRSTRYRAGRPAGVLSGRFEHCRNRRPAPMSGRHGQAPALVRARTNPKDIGYHPKDEEDRHGSKTSRLSAISPRHSHSFPRGEILPYRFQGNGLVVRPAGSRRPGRLWLVRRRKRRQRALAPVQNGLADRPARRR